MFFCKICGHSTATQWELVVHLNFHAQQSSYFNPAIVNPGFNPTLNPAIINPGFNATTNPNMNPAIINPGFKSATNTTLNPVSRGFNPAGLSIQSSRRSGGYNNRAPLGVRHSQDTFKHFGHPRQQPTQRLIFIVPNNTIQQQPPPQTQFFMTPNNSAPKIQMDMNGKGTQGTDDEQDIDLSLRL
ncbi:hypothetical protein O6P43_026852 [Quillaja saponaria]|uniref:C2H2-type domain-containing protein n=1 Tax=Quillaja saponaria TaxID=32244 RepID=A0AAD7L357_QUISA|nr:hypothetical protein O6P43_026852 [Quillaja saponaria]